ncbi:Ankyrin repeat-containing domain,Ankyrin repeat [Cinara cedri]|uniref:Ankyrin repeat-containing domain,Ankyrin repeat n=1 Tax=Cinara cedri TaxID=506608 RepID=A0A5E4N7A3_9HEMI|nr:Ankyrin repeat-containing domain,Ankyrin repeat [Cinara cedri]
MAVNNPTELDSIPDDFLALRIAMEKNYLEYFVTRLNRIDPANKLKILNQKFVKDDQSLTLLIYSIIIYRFLITRLLIDNGVDLNAKGSIKLPNDSIDEVTPLWCAATCGNISIIKVLVQRGAVINLYTECKSNPLIAACYYGSIKCVEYLVNNGADINVCNKNKNSCLSISSYIGYESIVQFLLNNGADVDSQNTCGFTAMHFAVKKNRLNIIRLLILKEAKQLKNIEFMTPILIAAQNTFSSIVHFLADFNLEQEKIDAYELLGASFLNSKENYNFEQGFSALLTAMEMRSTHKIEKQPYKRIAAYNNQIECKTVQDLMYLKNVHEALHYESLIIRERILGEDKPDLLLPSIIYRGDCYADVDHYEPCLKLWCHALQLSQNNCFSVTVDLLPFIQVFCKMIKSEINIELLHLKNVLLYAVNESLYYKYKIAKNIDKKEIVKQNMYENMKIIMSLIIIISITLEKECNLEHPIKQKLLNIITKINKMNLRSENNMTLLHMCVKCDITLDKFITTIVWFPHFLSMKLLLTCGADVNALDNEQNTPLNNMVNFFIDYPFMPHDMDLNSKKIIEELLNAGTHTDIVNKSGWSPHSFDLTNIYPCLKISPRKLTCLAACTLKYKTKKEYYCDKLPEAVLKFIDLH